MSHRIYNTGDAGDFKVVHWQIGGLHVSPKSARKQTIISVSLEGSVSWHDREESIVPHPICQVTQIPPKMGLWVEMEDWETPTDSSKTEPGNKWISEKFIVYVTEGISVKCVCVSVRRQSKGQQSGSKTSFKG